MSTLISMNDYIYTLQFSSCKLTIWQTNKQIDHRLNEYAVISFHFVILTFEATHLCSKGSGFLLLCKNRGPCLPSRPLEALFIVHRRWSEFAKSDNIISFKRGLFNPGNYFKIVTNLITKYFTSWIKYSISPPSSDNIRN